MNVKPIAYQSAVLAPSVTTQEGVSQPLSYSIPQDNQMQDKAQASGFAEKFGGWVHRNQWFTKEPITYLGYQFSRAAASSVPYGFGMAGVHHAMGMLGQWGQNTGYTEQGIKAINSKDIGFAKANTNTDFYKVGRKAQFGRHAARLAGSPLNAVFQIAVAFTMFRFTGGIVKTLRDKITNPENTEEQTIQEVKDIGKTIKETATKNWPAESGATPWAAVTLGFINANFKATTPYQRLPGVDGKPKESFGKAVKRVWSPQSKLLQNAAIWTLGYSAFFEISERLFKDQQIKRGTWSGHENSLKKTKDTLTAPHTSVTDATIEGKEKPAYEKPAWHSGITEDPSLGRILFRRVLPVAVGISAYAAMKRVGYVAAGGPMKPITDTVMKNGGKGAKSTLLGKEGGHARTFLGNAWREGAATSMFFTLWAATDAMGGWFDKAFGAKPVEATPKQQKNHDELLAKINEKMQVAGRAA